MLHRLKRWLRAPISADIDAASSLPPVEQIRDDDDVSAFMHPKVDESRRRDALRALFHKPKFNRRDGLDDYDKDHRLAHTGSRLGPTRQA